MPGRDFGDFIQFPSTSCRYERAVIYTFYTFYATPCASIASTTFSKPAMLAPAT